MIDIVDARQRFTTQKGGAARRGIEWKFTFPQWLEWWGEDYFRRGTGHDQLQMQRYHDKGVYELGNVHKGYPRDNSKTAGACTRLANARRDALALEERIDATEAEPSKDWRPFTDDEWEIIRETHGGYRCASFLR